MPEYREHPARPARLEGDALVVLGEGERTVWFYLDEDEWEGLLARPLAPGLARVCAVPMFAYEVGLGDEVRVEEREDGALVATGIARDAGSHTLRVLIAADAGGRWRELMADLAPHRCWLDVYSPRLVAVSVDPDALTAVTDYLRAREERGELAFEVGRTAA